MSVFLVRRFLTFVLTLWGASIIIFTMLEILPGDPALTILGVDAPDSAVIALRQNWGSIGRPGSATATGSPASSIGSLARHTPTRCR